MWDALDFPPLDDSDTQLFDFERDIMNKPRPARAKIFLRYLALYYDGEYTNGLTVYSSGSGLIGIEAHFRNISKLSGSCKGSAQHFPILCNERIAHVWIRVVDNGIPIVATPTIVVSITAHVSIILLIYGY
jgi:hypothetical protein